MHDFECSFDVKIMDFSEHMQVLCTFDLEIVDFFEKDAGLVKFCSKSCFSHEGMVRMYVRKPTASKRKHEDMRETQGKTRGF